MGFELYSELLSQVTPKYHAITAGIAPPNAASIRLHEKCGFQKIGHFSEIGRKFGKWIDVGLAEEFEEGRGRPLELPHEGSN